MRETLVLVPGLLCDETVWRHQQAFFADRVDVRVPDLREPPTITEMARLVLDSAPARFSLAGHSMGGRVALEMVRLAPDRISRLALLDTGVHAARLGEEEARQRLVDLSARDGMSALAAAWLPPMVRAGAFERDRELRAEMFAMVERMSPEIHRRQISALLDRPDATAVLPAIRCPTLVGVGEHDAWSPPAQHQAFAELIHGATMTIFPGAGHMAPSEAPVAVNLALDAWLSSRPAPPAKGAS